METESVAIYKAGIEIGEQKRTEEVLDIVDHEIDYIKTSIEWEENNGRRMEWFWKSLKDQLEIAVKIKNKIKALDQ